MTTLRDIVKDRKVYSVEAMRTVLEAARFMMEHNIGAVPVLRDGELAGILSERDVMNRVVAVGRTPGTTAVSEVMTPNPRAVGIDETVEECLFIMREFGFRRFAFEQRSVFRQLLLRFEKVVTRRDQFFQSRIFPGQFLRTLRIVESLRVVQRGLDFDKAAAEFFNVRAQVHFNLF